jgi:hypothetical protein
MLAISTGFEMFMCTLSYSSYVNVLTFLILVSSTIQFGIVKTKESWFVQFQVLQKIL